ncbi:MAG TPA: lipoyl(octanoyl) transferase LipB, partial [Phycisphaerae bacterium]|nr:lipoyl(octanoyl) transferase LipB [Phycisphaerae bacterium]
LENKYPAGVLLFVEHPPVITIGRRPGSEVHLLADAELLKTRGVSLIQSDRGGDVTFHGPGQLVAYPILPLNDYHMGLHDYMRFLEQSVIDGLYDFGIRGHREEGATGVWVDSHRDGLERRAKICAFGVKLRKWISLHGLALNVTTDLSFFDLINPCGLGRPVTSLAIELGEKCPAMPEVKNALANVITAKLRLK